MIITDASVAVKWYVSEIYTAEAEKLLDASYEIHAPELILPETRQHHLEKPPQGRFNRQGSSTDGRYLQWINHYVPLTPIFARIGFRRGATFRANRLRVVVFSLSGFFVL